MIEKNYNLNEIENLREIVFKVIDLYINRRLSIYKISCQFDLSRETVRRILKANNVPMRRGSYKN
jgi:hypothetical protein